MPLYTLLGVKNSSNRAIETLGLPMTVIGAAVSNTPEKLDDETLEFAYKVAPQESWEEKYILGSYNSIKWDENTNNKVIDEYGPSNVIILMFKCINSSKTVSLKALIKLTEASYSVTSDYDQFCGPYIVENDIGLTKNNNTRIRTILEGYRNFINDFISYPFLHLGFLHFILIVAVLSKCKFNLIGLKKMLYIIPVFTYNFGTTLLLTGAEDSTRFFFYTYLLTPVLLVFLFNQEQINSYSNPIINDKSDNNHSVPALPSR